MSSHTTLVSAEQLATHLGDPSWVLVDCRFSLQDLDAGRAAWRQGTIAGAVYASLDDDLSGEVVAGKTGRHPLPSVDRIAQTLGAWGIGAQTQVVAFDDKGGPFAARLWWMLRWLGHDAVAVLDGGLRAWAEAGQALAPGQPPVRSEVFTARPRPEMIVTADEVLTAREAPTVAVLDARAAPRFSGEHEPIDPVAGHIAGAINAPFADNLADDQRLLSRALLRQRYDALLGERGSGDAICYCGSGVTACHDILAMAHAGLALPRLYVGSWSEWITDPQRPRQ
ncbi:MAG: sulfurtransferase [Nannocystaceae bacterium]|nr:sulfurtransferase [Nannocystaceae bacterium]